MAGDNFDALRKALETYTVRGSVERDDWHVAAHPRWIGPLLAERDALQAKVEAMWQPIETAPKAPGFIIAGNADEGWTEQAWWDDDREQWWAVNTHWTDAYGDALRPTHWMPLPAPPAIDAARAALAQPTGEKP